MYPVVTLTYERILALQVAKGYLASLPEIASVIDGMLFVADAFGDDEAQVPGQLEMAS